MSLYRALARPVLFRLDPETAQKLTIKALGVLPPKPPPRVQPVTLAGLSFANPIGLAAGFDKGAEAISGAFRLGFGHVEVGTVTPKPQPGNPTPRMFRLGDHGAVINRFGFNSEGHAVIRERLECARRPAGGVIGVNLGVNKTSNDPEGDYVDGIRCFANLADYLTINISSPNTPGLRGLQARDRLATLLKRVLDARDGVTSNGNRPTPLFLKVSPDLATDDLDDISAVLRDTPVDALIVSNTTITRPGLGNARHAAEAGGLSGRPIEPLATQCLSAFHTRLSGQIPLIGVGGIASPDAMRRKFKAGAQLVQVYTGLAYEGPDLVRKLLAALDASSQSESG